ncbi:MAG TPA: HAMP domain-containing sensor histidine kinase [Candidatus Rifleibacterium sp.]|nr:HAMP domain-containing sensor histidine kinase [Candidatus Rifleibacterium sp.]HPW57837.1 HAMP domain-containing sensor histidine kinase [Candidatus Rifleibacterium sp.]
MGQLKINSGSIPVSGNFERRTVFSAFFLALSYLFFGLLYIYFSGKIAVSLAKDVDQLEFIERYKGFVFIFISAAGLFFLAEWLMRRIMLREREIAEYRTQMLRADQRATAGLLASSIAHNIKNLLMGVDYAVNSLDPQKLPKPADISILQKANADLKGLADSLCKVHEQRTAPAKETFNLTEFVKDTVNFARFHKKLRGCFIETEIPESCMFKGNRSLLGQMLLNLLINAGDATANSGRILVKVSEEGSDIVLEIQDSGTGVPEEIKEKIMQPLFTTKPDGCGLGMLSLEICCHDHAGMYSIQTSSLGGAAFVIHFPVQSAA